jgi:hypothetical protein
VQLKTLTKRLYESRTCIFDIVANGEHHDMGFLDDSTLDFVKNDDFFIFNVQFPVQNQNLDEPLEILMRTGNHDDPPVLISGFPATLNELERMRHKRN